MAANLVHLGFTALFVLSTVGRVHSFMTKLFHTESGPKECEIYISPGEEDAYLICSEIKALDEVENTEPMAINAKFSGTDLGDLEDDSVPVEVTDLESEPLDESTTTTEEGVIHIEDEQHTTEEGVIHIEHPTTEEAESNEPTTEEADPNEPTTEDEELNEPTTQESIVDMEELYKCNCGKCDCDTCNCDTCNCGDTCDCGGTCDCGKCNSDT